MIFPHKTDAYAECCQLQDKIRSYTMSPNRHRQQSDTTISRQEAMKSIQEGSTDFTYSLSNQKEEQQLAVSGTRISSGTLTIDSLLWTLCGMILWPRVIQRALRK